MTAVEYAETLGNNCRVLKMNASTAATMAEQASIADEHFDDFWHGYYYGRAHEITPLPVVITS